MVTSTPPAFPAVTGTNLLGHDVRFPDGLAGSPRVVIVAFRQWQQSDVDSWVGFLEDRVEEHPGLRFYEVPAISGVWSPTRRFIDGGMAAAIRDRAVLERTITYYGDLRKLTEPLGIERRSRIQLLLLDDAGAVVWQGSGSYAADTATSLVEALDALATGAAPARPAAAPRREEDVDRFEFEWNPRYRRLLTALGVGPASAWVEVTADRLVVRFGPWSLETPLGNVADTRVTGDYAAYRAIGPRLSLADRGVTFGTDTSTGVCVCFEEPVPALLPTGCVTHPAATLTLAEPERFRTLLDERTG